MGKTPTKDVQEARGEVDYVRIILKSFIQRLTPPSKDSQVSGPYRKTLLVFDEQLGDGRQLTPEFCDTNIEKSFAFAR